MLKIGVSGGIGSGKSTVCQFFREAGAFVFNADAEAKEILDGDLIIRDSIVDNFGKEILAPDGTINKRELARLAFSSPEKQQILNQIMHPAVFRKLQEDFDYIDKSGAYKFFVVDAPLLFEAGWYKEMDYNIIVYAPENLRLKRAEKRGAQSQKDIRARMRLQMPEEVKKRMADFVIENDGTLEDLKKKVHEVIKRLEVMF